MIIRIQSIQPLNTLAAFLVAMTIIAIGSSASAAVTDIVLYRLGDDDPGAVAGNTGNAVTKEAAGGADLTRGGDPIYSSNTPGGASLLSMAFDGTSDAYTGSPPATTLSDNFGIEAWVKGNTGALGGNSVLAFNGNTSSRGAGLFRFGSNYGVLHGGIALWGGSAPVTDDWVHLAVVRDSGTSTFYIDGIANAAFGAMNTPNATDTFMIGAQPGGVEPFTGQIDHVRVFSFAAGEFDAQADLTLNLSVPEPSSLLLSALGLLSLSFVGWRRQRRV